MEKETELKILTLNCWGIPVIAKDRQARMQAIAEFLATNHYDIVCLQEVWSNADFISMRDKIVGCYPFAHYFYSGVVGSGICMFSKYPFRDVFFHQWSVNGYIHKLQHGDWFGGKGVGMCRLKVNDYNINVYSAHLHAEYSRTCDEYQAHRVIQAFDTAQFIQMTSGAADFVVLAGDLNTEPGDLAYRILTETGNLRDAYMEADEVAQETSSTNEDLANSYTAPSLLKENIPGKRIDYIMYSTGSNVKVELKKYLHPLPSRVPGCSYSYSDHEAVTATLRVAPNGGPSSVDDANVRSSIIRESIEICEQAVKRLTYNKNIYWFWTALLFMLLITTLAAEAPFNYKVLYDICRIAITGFMGFTLIMATLWNSIETNAVYAGKLAMELTLKKSNHFIETRAVEREEKATMAGLIHKRFSFKDSFRVLFYMAFLNIGSLLFR